MLKRVETPSLKGRFRARPRARPPATSVPKARKAIDYEEDEQPKVKDTRVSSPAAKKLDDLARRIRICTKCPLHASRTIAVPGEGKSSASVMIIGEAPGKQEDQTGRPFVGNAGRYLEHVLEGTPFTREDFFITNIVKCRPPSNRTPKTNEIETCTSLYLSEQIKLIEPKLIF